MLWSSSLPLVSAARLCAPSPSGTSGALALPLNLREPRTFSLLKRSLVNATLSQPYILGIFQWMRYVLECTLPNPNFSWFCVGEDIHRRMFPTLTDSIRVHFSSLWNWRFLKFETYLFPLQFSFIWTKTLYSRLGWDTNSRKDLLGSVTDPHLGQSLKREVETSNCKQ